MLGKDKLNSIEDLISKVLTIDILVYDEFVSENNVLRENYEMKQEIKNPETSKQNRLMLLSNFAVCGKKKTDFC